jgi:hypothetical protein
MVKLAVSCLDVLCKDSVGNTIAHVCTRIRRTRALAITLDAVVKQNPDPIFIKHVIDMVNKVVMISFLM